MHLLGSGVGNAEYSTAGLQARRAFFAVAIRLACDEGRQTRLIRIRAIENAFEVIPISQEAAQTFGELKTNLEKQGTPLDDFDLILAACALTHNCTLVTNNVKHFGRIAGLRLANWAA